MKADFGVESILQVSSKHTAHDTTRVSIMKQLKTKAGQRYLGSDVAQDAPLKLFHTGSLVEHEARTTIFDTW